MSHENSESPLLSVTISHVKIRLLVELLICEFHCIPSLFRPCSSVSVLERKAQIDKSDTQYHTCRGCCGSTLY